MTVLDARAHRTTEGGPSFSLGNRLARLSFGVIWLLFARWTPRQMNAWRRLILRAFGAKVHAQATVYGSARIWLPANLSLGKGSTIGAEAIIYNQGTITIGENSIISQRAHLCSGTHDHRDPVFQLQTRPIAIGDRVWIAAEAFVGPGVHVPDGVVLGARGCLFRDAAAWTVYSGNPALPIRERVMRG